MNLQQLLTFLQEDTSVRSCVDGTNTYTYRVKTPHAVLADNCLVGEIVVEEDSRGTSILFHDLDWELIKTINKAGTRANLPRIKIILTRTKNDLRIQTPVQGRV